MSRLHARRTWRAVLLPLVVALSIGCARIRPDPEAVARLAPELGQLLLVGFNGTELDGNAELQQLLCTSRVGGVLVFARNVVDAGQVRRLTAGATVETSRCTDRALLVAVDAEGGQVMRLGPRAGFSPTLSARELGEANDFAETELEGRRVATMLRDAGINWDLAPVVDVGYNPSNPVIVGHGRSFGANPRLVTEHARAWLRGMQAAGVLTALKHFPGHGSSFTDSHLGFVDVTETANPDIELLPYRALIADGVVDAVMTAHVFNRHIDAVYPATLSRGTISRLLRRDLGFRGVVVTDDLRMGAIEQQYGLGDAAVLALEAGADMLLIADDRLPDGRSAAAVTVSTLRDALVSGRINTRRIAEALERIASLKARVPSRRARATAPPRACPEASPARHGACT